MEERGANRWAPIAVLATFSALCVPLLHRDVTVFDDLDERLFHLPTIQQFAAEFPSPDLVDYPSATTPLYHLVLATLALLGGDGLGTLRGANLLISLVAVWIAMRALGGGARAAMLCTPLALSPYFVGPAVRLSTDNAALIGVFLTVGLLAHEPRRPVGAGLAAAAAVMTRQIHAWLIGLLLVRALRDRTGRAWAALLLPCVLLGGLLAGWGALTPPGFARGHSSGLNLHTLIFAVSMFGLYGPFLAGWLGPIAWAHKARVGAAVAAAALLLALVSMPYVEDPNRWGGAIWQIAARSPELLGVPLSFWVLFPLGAGVLAAIGSSSRQGAFVLLVVGLWLLANLASARAYQKYYDPMSLFILGMAVQPLKGLRLAWLGPATLSAGLGAVTLTRFYG